MLRIAEICLITEIRGHGQIIQKTPHLNHARNLLLNLNLEEKINQ